MINAKLPENELRKYAIKNGMRTLREAGIKKVLEGKTTPEELLRIIMI